MRFQFIECTWKVHYYSQFAPLNWLLPEYGMYKSHRNRKADIDSHKKVSSISKGLV